MRERKQSLYEPRPARVRATARGCPLEVDGVRVLAVRETWLLEDRWWGEQPLCRRYWELLMASGRNAVVFCELPARRWFAQL